MQWEQLTKRTNDPKLYWLEKELEKMGIKSRRNGNSFYAPILEVDSNKVTEAWDVLIPVDDISDNHEMFTK